MKVPAAGILKEFVDRTRELAGFERLLTASTTRIVCVHGPGGIGKSLLLSRMMEECERRGVRWVHIAWEDSRRYNYLDLMRRLRDGTESSLFHLFNDRVNFYTVPEYNVKISVEGGSIQNVQVLSGGVIQESGVTIHVGHTIEIKDLNLDKTRPDRDVTENEVIIGLTHAFMPCLRAVTSEHPLVVFLDALEKADNLTLNWIWKELLVRIRDEEIPNLLFILSGRQPFERDPTFFDCAAIYELKPFQEDHILDYLEKKGLGRNEMLAGFIWKTFNGNPLDTAKSVKSFLEHLTEK